MKKKKPESNKIYNVTFSADSLYLVHMRAQGMPAVGEQGIRDRNYIVNSIEESGFDHIRALELVDSYKARREKLVEEGPDGETRVFSQKSSRDNDIRFFEEISELCDDQAILLKRRHMDYIKKLVIGDDANPVSWQGDNTFIVERILDSLKGATEYVDDNSDLTKESKE
jgi:hypothetical protein